MNEHRSCPECNSHDTEHVHTEVMTDAIERVRVCNDCPAQFTVSYGDPVRTDIHTAGVVS